MYILQTKQSQLKSSLHLRILKCNVSIAIWKRSKSKKITLYHKHVHTMLAA